MDLEVNKRAAIENEYRCVEIKNNKVCGISSYLFSWGIVVDITEKGYSHRYCYPDLLRALSAYEDWDGVGEPEYFVVRKGPKGHADYCPDDPFTEGVPLPS